ncbi:MAG: glycosyltransferase family 39 protein [Nanoarchaeota archaeon]|nr:glycosyltransferase family 39 protein [Nanoarchaeota archaeon]
MKFTKQHDIIALTLLFVGMLVLWTLPLQSSSAPYGEVDAASHYAIAEFSYAQDRAMNSLPTFIDKRYGHDNKYKPHTLWYPPPFHMGLAVGSVVGGSSDVPIYLMNSLFASLIVLSVFFLLRKLYGLPIAFASALLLLFSMRDILITIWGQWPERMGFAYLPLVLYCAYAYIESFLNNDEKPVYLVLLSLLLSVNLFIHPMDFFHTIAALGLFTLFVLIKERKWCFNTKHLVGVIVLFFLVISLFPTQTLNVFVRLGYGGSLDQPGKGEVGRLFSWFDPQSGDQGVPSSYFSYSEMIAPSWTALFVWLGVLALCMRRNRRDLLMLAWVSSLYVMIHLDFLGMGRVHRSLSGSAHIFFPLMMLGVWYLVSFVPLRKDVKSLAKFSGIVLFTIVLLFSIAPRGYTALKDAYPSVTRVNSDQLALTDFLKGPTVPEDATLLHLGSLSLAKTRWIRTIGHRYVKDKGELSEYLYIIFDYSDFARIGRQDLIEGMIQLEGAVQNSSTVLYSTSAIRVYKQ